jgi:acetyl esterase/lipase
MAGSRRAVETHEDLAPVPTMVPPRPRDPFDPGSDVTETPVCDTRNANRSNSCLFYVHCSGFVMSRRRWLDLSCSRFASSSTPVVGLVSPRL